MKFYGIRNKKTRVPVGFMCSSNGDAEDCNDVQFELDLFYPDNIWLVANPQDAQRALVVDTEWYNASHDHPRSSIVRQKDASDYEVFEVTILTDEQEINHA